MSTNIKYLFFAVASLLSLSCARIENYNLEESEGVEITLTAVREGYDPETKTILKTDGSVEWLPADEISVFYNKSSKGGSRFTSQNTEQTAVADFRGIIDGVSGGGEEFTNGKYIYGVYPYSQNTTFSNDTTTINLPYYQTASAGTFSNGLFPTIARTNSLNLAFYNICGGVKFTVSRNDITSVSFKGNNGEKIAGETNVIFDASEKPVVVWDKKAGKNEITVYAPNGGTFEVGKEYYLIAYPTKLTSGYTMTFRTSDLKEGSVTSNNATEIRRSIFGVLKEADKNISVWNDIKSIGGGTKSGIYLGIMGFNEELYRYPISQITSDSKTEFNSFIDGLNTANGTTLYHSVDEAINDLQSVPLPEDVSNVAIVTFTDGLDKGSHGKNGKYGEDIPYLNAINKRILNEKVHGQTITSYVIGLKGEDVTDESLFMTNLKKIASSSEKAMLVEDMSHVNTEFQKIAQQLSHMTNVQTINLEIPVQSDGTLVRFTFDNVKSASQSSVYIEGKYDIDTHTLEDVKYVGLNSTSGTSVKGTKNSIYTAFTFEGVQTVNNMILEMKFTDQWEYTSGKWQINSEFSTDQNSAVVIDNSSAVIMLVLDCSSSLKNNDKFRLLQLSAKKFIDVLYEAAKNNESNLNINSGNKWLYSKTPNDMSLAVWFDDCRYYLTQSEYNKAKIKDTDVVEGLTIVNGADSFIISLNDVQSDPIKSVDIARKLYSDVLPTSSQGAVISNKWSSINSALYNFNGTKLSSYYYTSVTSLNDSNKFTNCIYNNQGVVTTSSKPYIRGVRSTNDTCAIYWNDPNDLKLSVKINGGREFCDMEKYKDFQSFIDEVEGVAVFAGGERFIVELSDAEDSPISSVETAKTKYGPKMPNDLQAKIISAKWTDINNAIQQYNGTKLKTTSGYGYYTQSTAIDSTYQYGTRYINCLSNGCYGELTYTDNSPYVRRVINIE